MSPNIEVVQRSMVKGKVRFFRVFLPVNDCQEKKLMLAEFKHLYYRHDMVKANDQHVLWQLEIISFVF